MYTIQATSKSRALLQSALNLDERQHNEIHDLIMRFSSDYDLAPHIGEWVHSASLGTWDPASHGPSVRGFLLNELSRKLMPFGGNQSPVSISNCYRKWIAAELKCSETNRIFMAGPSFTSPRQRATVRRARELIKTVLGRCKIDKIVALSGPGPGSSFFTERNKTGQYFKYLDESNLSFTPSSEQFLEELVMGDDLWWRALFGHAATRSSTAYQNFLSKSCRTTLGNRLTTVPKTSTTSRPISIEAGLTLMLQKGAGSYIRKRLKSVVGIDLDHQQSFHKQLVIDEWERIATIDLSSASDTIAYHFVKYMLPDNWFLFLDSLRSEAVQVPGGKWYYTQKFSSMGNGYTFELETLIFWALAQSVSELSDSTPVSGNRAWLMDPDFKFQTGMVRNLCTCFGDDIIVTSRAEEELLALLDFCGFIVNTDKTFRSNSAFKESCGTYSLFGKQLPVFNIESLDTVQDLFVLCNNLLWAADCLEALGLKLLSRQYCSLREKVIVYIPHELRYVGPRSSIMDSYLHVRNPEPARRSHVSRLQYRLKRRQYFIVDQWSDHTAFIEKWSGATIDPSRVKSLVQLDLSQQYYVFPRLITIPIESRDSAGDYFGMSIYSLRDARFTPAIKRGAVEVRTALAVMTADDVLSQSCKLELPGA